MQAVVIRSALALSAVAFVFLTVVTAAHSQREYYDGPGDYYPHEPPVEVAPPPPPPPPPAPMEPPPIVPPAPARLAFPTPTPPPFSPGIVLPSDVSAAAADLPAQPPGLRPLLNNLTLITDGKFPLPKNGKDKGDGIIVRAGEEASIERPSPCSVKVHNGKVLVSVRRPSEVGLAITPLAEVSLSPDSDVLIVATGDLVRVLNLDSRGNACRIKLSNSLLKNAERKIISVRPGTELLFSNSKLSRRDLRPSDGIARRRAKVLEDGRLALTEFSLATVVQSCDLIAQLEQEKSNVRVQRVMMDMSKMAAVLNYTNGPGFTYGSQEQIAAKGATH